MINTLVYRKFFVNYFNYRQVLSLAIYIYLYVCVALAHMQRHSIKAMQVSLGIATRRFEK